MLSAAAQSGNYPDGIERLKALLEKLEGSDTDKNLVAYIKFRQLTTSYVLSLQAAKADTAKIQAIQAKWLKTLENFVADYPTAPDSAEAMLQLAISHEFGGQEDDAKRWYGRIVAEFPEAPAARKAAGAQTRLDCVGRVLAIQGQTRTGRQIDTSQYARQDRARPVLDHHFAGGQGRHGHAERDVEQVRAVVGGRRRQPRQ